MKPPKNIEHKEKTYWSGPRHPFHPYAEAGPRHNKHWSSLMRRPPWSVPRINRINARTKGLWPDGFIYEAGDGDWCFHFGPTPGRLLKSIQGCSLRPHGIEVSQRWKEDWDGKDITTIDLGLSRWNLE